MNIHEENELGLMERKLFAQLTGPQERLKYDTAILKMSNGFEVEEYIIPEEDKEEVLKQLYLFGDCPEINEVRIDLHTNKHFKVSDFKVIREGDLNFLATPYYAEAGGTVLDWIEDDEIKITNVMIKTLKVKL